MTLEAQQIAEENKEDPMNLTRLLAALSLSLSLSLSLALRLGLARVAQTQTVLKIG